MTMSHPFPGDITNELVRHFLIETSPRGVKLKGCPNEPNFGECPGVVPTQPFGSLAFAGLSEQSNQVSGRAPAPASWGQSKTRRRNDAGQGENEPVGTGASGRAPCGPVHQEHQPDGAGSVLTVSLSPQAASRLWSTSTPSCPWPCPASWSFLTEVRATASSIYSLSSVPLQHWHTMLSSWKGDSACVPPTRWVSKQGAAVTSHFS